MDVSGNLYIADRNNNRIRKVSGVIITTVAGGGTSLFDGGSATGAQLISPNAVAVDATGNLYIADSGNHIRKVTGGIISTIAGTGDPGLSGDNGPATRALMRSSEGIAVDSAGNVFFSDTLNDRIRKISDETITSIAGTTTGFSGDNGPATSAQLFNPTGLALDPAGNVYFADSYNNRVRILTPAATSCSYVLTPPSVQATASGGSFPIGIQTSAGCSWSATGLPNWITVSGSNSGSGPGTVTLLIAANAGAALSATISIGGVSLPVTEAGGACVYTTSPGGQSFSAAGGTGSISVTAGAGCAWTLTHRDLQNFGDLMLGKKHFYSTVCSCHVVLSGWLYCLRKRSIDHDA